ncbi:NosD domain-containing protein [Brevundimonas sp.]|jgi:3-dehydroshikimate dehydratase|uniref:NosD domain-containing protein n=1 Tax=Brevundimonas sp. TaxID=1871086 RepID=UPI0037BF06FC
MNTKMLLATTAAITVLALPALAQTPPPAGQPIAAVAAGGPAAPTVQLTTLTVDRYDDDSQPGSLRWAVETNNTDPGKYRIEIAAPATGEAAIVLKSPLPPIKGPVAIEGMAWRQDGRYTAIDGSGYLARDLKSCPGAVDGQYGTNVRTTAFPGLALIDTRGVSLTGLEVRNFCIGVLVLRSSNNVIADNRFVRNIGGAGVMFSGDNGSGGSTSDTTNDNKVLRNSFYENGDGLELTRGAAFNLIADNVFDAGEDNLEPSQGIEILWGNDNAVVRNRFLNYTDGLQLNWGARNYIGANLFRGNAFGVSVTGASNMIDGNDIRENGVGIAVRPEVAHTANRISQNILADNGKPILRCSAGGSCSETIPRGGIVFGLPGLEHLEYVGSRGMGVVQDRTTAPHICSTENTKAGCQAAPELGQVAPTVTSVRRSGSTLTVAGQATGPASTRLTVEVFAGKPGTTEGERHLGSIVAATDAQGRADFSGQVATTAAGDAVTATVTTAAGASSPFSAPVRAGR